MTYTSPSQGLFTRLRSGRNASAFGASLLLMTSTALSGLLGMVRVSIIADLFGAGSRVDAYTAAFELPETISYLVIGGVASTTFVKLLTQYHADGNEAEGDRALSNILNVMLVILSAAMLLAALFAPMYVRYKFHNFSNFSDAAETTKRCIDMTRMLLATQVLLFAGGVFGSRLLVRKIFLYQAMQPLLYNIGIIAGAVLFHRWLDIYSLAVGAVFGAFVGFFLVNLIGARSIGMRWSPQFDWRHPALREWLRLSLPLMLGQSLVTLDPWIRSYFASQVEGSIALMNYSRQLFNTPMNMIGPAAGAASLPFFASLWARQENTGFASAVNRSVSRLMSVSLLLTTLMLALASPVIDVMLHRGRFHSDSAAAAATLFMLFCLSLVFWTSQNLYSRAFYAAGNTLTPMISGTVVTVCMLPVYALLFHHHGIPGLVIASDIGIAAHMISLAVLLDRKGMVPIAGLEWGELAKSLLAAVLGGFAAHYALGRLPLGATHAANVLRLAAGLAIWLAVIATILLGTRSALPAALLRRRSKSVQAADVLPVQTETPDAPDR